MLSFVTTIKSFLLSNNPIFSPVKQSNLFSCQPIQYFLLSTNPIFSVSVKNCFDFISFYIGAKFSQHIKRHQIEYNLSPDGYMYQKCTYISGEIFEWMDHVKPMEIHNPCGTGVIASVVNVLRRTKLVHQDCFRNTQMYTWTNKPMTPFYLNSF